MDKRWLIVISCCWLGAGGLLPSQAGPGDTPRAPCLERLSRHQRLAPAVKKAQEALRRNDFPRARALCEKILQTAPGHPEAHFLLALLGYREAQYPAAIGHIERAEAGYADLDSCWRQVLTEREKLRQAEREALRQYSASLPEVGEKSSCHGVIYDRHKTAAEEKLRALEEGGGKKSDSPFTVPAEVHFQHGNVLNRLGRIEEALTQFDAALAVAPRHQGAATNRIVLLWQSGRADLARQRLAEAQQAGLAIDPGLAALLRGDGKE